MNKLQPIQIPEGVFYLGNYPELLNLLPSQTFIFNKVMTGCGATTMFLDDAIPTVLCSPRKELIHCKANSNRYMGKVHLFGSTSEDVLVCGFCNCIIRNFGEVRESLPVSVYCSFANLASSASNSSAIRLSMILA